MNRPPSKTELEQAIKNYHFPNHPSPLPAFLLDAYHPHLYGGTGRVTDWALAADAARRYDILLAGSLTPANVAEAVRSVRPWGVDVSSGVEAEPGRKDHAKVRAFIQNAKLY
jgi:phosphoribosylanthranilate isomerase